MGVGGRGGGVKWGGGGLTNERQGLDHVKISGYGPLQNSDGRQEYI